MPHIPARRKDDLVFLIRSVFFLQKQFFLVVRRKQNLNSLARKRIHPNAIITHRFALKDTDRAYAIFATGKTGKVCVNMEME